MRKLIATSFFRGWWIQFNEGAFDFPGWPVLNWQGRSLYVALKWGGRYHRWFGGPRFKRTP